MPSAQNGRLPDEAMAFWESDPCEMIGRGVWTWGEAHPYRIACGTEMIREAEKQKNRPEIRSQTTTSPLVVQNPIN